MASTVAFPASILDRSRMSLSSVKRCAPLRRMVCAWPRRSRGSRSPSRSRSAKPRMAVSGVRSSWLMLARNSLLARLADASARLARPRSRVRAETRASRSSLRLRHQPPLVLQALGALPQPHEHEHDATAPARRSPPPAPAGTRWPTRASAPARRGARRRARGSGPRWGRRAALRARGPPRGGGGGSRRRAPARCGSRRRARAARAPRGGRRQRAAPPRRSAGRGPST